MAKRKNRSKRRQSPVSHDDPSASTQPENTGQSDGGSEDSSTIPEEEGIPVEPVTNRMNPKTVAGVIVILSILVAIGAAIAFKHVDPKHLGPDIQPPSSGSTTSTTSTTSETSTSEIGRAETSTSGISRAETSTSGISAPKEAHPSLP